MSHRLDEVFSIADRITVMRDGSMVGTAETQAATAADIIAQMTGKPAAEAYPSRGAKPIGAPVLQVKNASNTKLKNILLTLRAGEVVGVAGLVGSGRSAVLRSLAGDQPFSSGKVRLAGTVADLSSPVKAWRSGIALVPEERRSQGLVMRASVRANICYRT